MLGWSGGKGRAGFSPDLSPANTQELLPLERYKVTVQIVGGQLGSEGIRGSPNTSLGALL